MRRRFSSSRRRELARALDGEPQLLGVPRLLHVREDVAVVDRVGEIVVIAEAGEQDALHVAVTIVGAREKLRALHRVHPHVADEDVERLARQRVERVAARRRRSVTSKSSAKTASKTSRTSSSSSA